MTADPIAETVASLMPRAKAELTELVAFQSVADPAQFPRSECEAAAALGAPTRCAPRASRTSRVLDTPDGTQSVYGFLPGPAGAPTVLLYAHYDVQPPLDDAAWVTPPFELTERDGRWYGRGAADCKGGFLMHLLALRALKANGGVPVNVKVIAEGSEEQGTGGLERYAEAHPELLTADTIVIGDAGQLPARAADGHGDAARHDAAARADRHPRRQPALRPVRRRRPGRAGRADPRTGLAARRGRLDDGGRAGRATRRWDGLQYPEARLPQGRQGAGRRRADRLGHGRRPHLGAPGRHRARHRLPAGGRRHAVRAGERPRADQPAGAAGRRTRPRRRSCWPRTWRRTRRGARGSQWSRSARARRSARTRPARRTRRWPTAMRVAYPGEEMQSAGHGRLHPAVQHPRRAVPARRRSC